MGIDHWVLWSRRRSGSPTSSHLDVAAAGVSNRDCDTPACGRDCAKLTVVRRRNKPFLTPKPCQFDLN
ncbi:hypothetical protein GCK32_007548 [Trichostrongylus colubriformis]|uniref:Uncharacterized protein n=1 Tax=Trichostrongylus colubriformis TaxID=6319 RepID=A0AAN8IBL2_TRICO